MAKRRDAGWRDRAAVDLLLRHLPGLDLRGSALVMEDLLPDVGNGLEVTGLDVHRWNRRAYDGRAATPWPLPGPHDVATLRLPRSKEELIMSLHAAASILRPEGQVLVYGAKDEGIQAAMDPLAGLFARVETVGVGGRCRVLGAVWQDGARVPRSSLADWRTCAALDYPGLPPTWVSYPGVFAHGRLDGGTRLLLESIPLLPSGSRVLDYGCGSGVVAWVARQRGENVVVELLDVDAVALVAAKENVPGAPVHLMDGLPPVDMGRFDAIVSNPPFHRGKSEHPEMVLSMIRESSTLLKTEGVLVFVAQKRLPVEETLRRVFHRTSILASDSTFRVWKGETPRREG